MPEIVHPGGVTVTLPESLTLANASAGDELQPSVAPRADGSDAAMQARRVEPSMATALLDILEKQGLMLATQLTATPSADAAAILQSSVGSGQSQDIDVQVELKPGEEAVILSERDGYFAWHFAQEADQVPGQSPVPEQFQKKKEGWGKGQSDLNGQQIERQIGPASATPRVHVVPGPLRYANFRISLHPLPLPLHPALRPQTGVVADVLFENVKTYVLKFIGKAVLGNAMRYLERHVSKGLTVLGVGPSERWPKVESLNALALPAKASVRILLFFHGTFSSTAGSFGALALTPWGRAFLQSAGEHYDAVLGYDHPSLSEDPFENATDLLARLNLDPVRPLVIDAVCFSRGALVYRSLTERLLPQSGMNVQAGRVIFIAGTNNGTRLAEPDNWRDLADLYTNLAAGSSRALQLIAPGQPLAPLLGEIIKGLGALVKYLATAVVGERRVPGLAAMEPDGDFIRALNLTQAGQIEPAAANYFAITSNFKARLAGGETEPQELPVRLIFKLIDGFADRLMQGSNDLVVDLASMTAIDAAVGGFVKDVFDYGENSLVYHTNYCVRPETVNSLVRWLHLPPPAAEQVQATAMTAGRTMTVAPGALVTADVPATVDTRFALVAADEALGTVVARVQAQLPGYLVIRQEDADAVTNLVLRAETMLDIAGNYALHDPVSQALDLVQAEKPELALTSSQVASMSASARYTNRVVVDDGRPIGVAPDVSALPSNQMLAELAARIDAPADARDHILRRRNMPAFSVRRAGTHEAQAAPQTAPCHFYAEMDQEVLLQHVTTVEVVVSREAIERVPGPAATHKAGAAGVDPARAIILQVIPRANCELAGPDRAELPAPAAGQPQSLHFSVRASNLGEATIWVVARQGQVPLVTLVLAPQVVRQCSLPARRTSVQAVAEEAAPLVKPLHQLRITEQLRGNQSFFAFDLESPELGIFDRFESPMLQTSSAQYVAALYRKIESFWSTNKGDIESFQAELRAYGAELFDELVPDKLQRHLWKHHAQIRSIMVISTEPFIPWELLHLKNPDVPGMPPETLFLAQMGLVRWLHGNWPPTHLRLDAVRYVIPDYKDPHLALPETAAEKAFLEQNFGATAVDPQPQAVRNLLATPGAFDVLHFACHGEADLDNIASARLTMQDRIEDNHPVRVYLSATTVDAFSNLQDASGARPLVVLNACQSGRGGFSLAGLGGFAQAFLKSGAGAFVGTLWSIGDFPGRSFTEKFYEALLKEHASLAEATIAAREAARQAEDASWLAYAVYGHPHATRKSTMEPP